MIDFEPTGNAISVITDTANRLTNFNKPLRQSGAYLERATKLRFAKEQDPDGNAWATLKKSTLRQKKTSAILRETSTMVNAISFLPPQGNLVRLVSPIDYSVWHQLGTKTMPARPFLGINVDDVNAIRTIFNNYLQS